MSEERCCGISGAHPYRDRRQCRTLKKLQVEVLTHLLLEGPGEGPHPFESVVQYVLKLEKEIRNRDEEITVVRALLAERPGDDAADAKRRGLSVAEMNAEIEHASPYGKDEGEKVPGEKRKIATGFTGPY